MATEESPRGASLSTAGSGVTAILRGDLPSTVELWLSRHAPWIEERLHSWGAILFRGFEVGDASRLEAFARALSRDFSPFSEESSPRSRVQGLVHTSTEYPQEYPIQFHNEFSYGRRWPARLYFCCKTPPATGGQTPLADVRRVLRRLSASTKRKFLEQGVLYERNFRDGLGVSWQAAFQAKTRDEVERRCADLGIDFRWSGGVLRTRHCAPAIVQHPFTGEELWFNHAFFFNVLSLEPVELRDFMAGEPPEDRSTNTYYGDGTPIGPQTIEEIRRAYAAEEIVFDWERGDVLWIDNMLCAHARRPFSGPREILAVLADGVSRDDLREPS